MFNICQIKYILHLTSSDCDVNVEDRNGDTPLIDAASEGNYMAMGKLLKGKKQNLNGQSALHKAAEKGHTSSVEMLIQNNAKIDIKDNAEDTPLHKVAGADTPFSFTFWKIEV